MTNTLDPTELARGWIQAWIDFDMHWLREYLAEDFEHSSPFGSLVGTEHYLSIVEPMAKKSVQKLVIKRVLAEDEQAVIWFENETAAGAVPSCDWLRIKGGKIASIQSFYDTVKVRSALSEEEQSALNDD
ncbi:MULTISPECIES: nuclear transport factor 2 family protein [Gammaproteobacteria]|uniref:nuclear transport factor 2 family protein n=1 Tax=Gammaproteobacteria TaxID=1236 RepID=UPI000DCF83FE|nr:MULTISPECIES: nuclear transport factor 2 family protein [Gammaproteobacteria]RTE87750.1 nuclear transport factor 2 family protein [Aliidiomarina sp. B3213]TCZ92468.1 nuclear transport factor 2 family protein [Lysobacter sp. N42]